MIELLAPAGTFEKMVVAFNYGADAVYFGGKKFGLRAFAGNFSDDDIIKATDYAHKLNKKVYITLNIVAKDDDFDELKEYIKVLEKSNVDGVIISDLGVMSLVSEIAPKLNIHVSTQANINNSYSINYLAKLGVKRIVLARELSIEDIKKIRKAIPKDIELEAFIHGAMCISYSGRCLLSNYLTGRDSNRGECVQACRWEYKVYESKPCEECVNRQFSITEKSRDGERFDIQEDSHGTYILNSKDLNMLRHIKELADAGVTSFKIEGRMKSPYYVANVVNAYRRAIDNLDSLSSDELDILDNELLKTSHRQYTTGFYFGADDKECLESSYPVQTSEFMAMVLQDSDGEKVLIEQRNRFKVGDDLEVLSPNETFNNIIRIKRMQTIEGDELLDAKNVQQQIYLYTDLPLKKYDILRKSTN